MALDALLARLEGRKVTPVTDRAMPDVTPKLPTTLVPAPLTCPIVTPVTCVTAKNEDTTDRTMEARRQRVLAMLRESPTARYAVVTDADSDPDAVIVALGIRGRATCELLIPSDRYDGVLLLDLIERHSGTVH
jgi:pyruvate/2-oxoacid:ferredoxin oxidoreductase alpha subunit